MNYTKQIVIKHEASWVTDFSFDFGSAMASISQFLVTPGAGITIGTGTIVQANQIMVRVSGGVAGTKYPVSVSATSPSGEVRVMSVVFQVL